MPSLLAWAKPRQKIIYDKQHHRTFSLSAKGFMESTLLSNEIFWWQWICRGFASDSYTNKKLILRFFYLSLESINMALRNSLGLVRGTLISIHETVSLSLVCLRVTMIGMTNLLDGFQSDSRVGEEKKCVL